MALALLCFGLCRCGGYDSQLIAPARHDDANPLDDGAIATFDSGTRSDAPVTGGGHGGGHGGGIAGIGGGGGSGGGGGGGGNTEPPGGSCQPNPGDAKCPEICPELCNGKDDDCDGTTDEEKPGGLCRLGNAEGICNAGACLIVECNGSYRDCDHDQKNGCETAEDDVGNCGTCGQTCKVGHGSPACVHGACVVDTCDKGWADCDSRHDDCETRTNTLIDCGGCGVACKDVPNAFPSCASGACGVESCKPGFGDCDQKSKNGCEQSLDTLADCNACNNACKLASCNGGVCTAVDCSMMPGMADCDGDGATCETSLLTDVDNCIACNAACSFNSGVTPNGTLICSAQGCDVSCDAGFGDCDGDYRNGCEAPLNSVQNCGTCGMNCNNALGNTASTSCDAGTLTCQVGTCDSGFADCDGVQDNGCEVSLHTVQNCGGCANKGQNQPCQSLANANTACAAGTCTITSCASSWVDCDANVANGCERDARTPANGGLGPCLPDAGCTKFSNTGHDYYYCSTARIWSDARAKCQLQLHGDLAQVVDATEKNLVQPHVAATAWISSNDSLVEGLWIWANNGMPFWQGTNSGATLFGQYANWASGEPNASGDCGAIYTNGTFDDTDCAATHPFICEVSPDACASDASKVDAGQCGCGMPDTDTDNDGFAVCNDACPSDANKRAAGKCGCGVADTDSDADGTPNCMDGCPNDAAKTTAGKCGCGVAETDNDADGTPNCMDGCPSDPTVTVACFSYTPRNFDPKPINWSTTPNTTLNCGTTTVNTSTTPATITNWCGTAPTPIVQTQSGGPNVVVLPLQGLTLSSGATLKLIGTLPVVIAVHGNVSIAGIVDANASGTTPGAGGSWSCATSQGGNGTGNCGDLNASGGGGGGGAFGTNGGSGGKSDDGNGGGAGVARGTATLSPLLGGCGGGAGGGSSGTPGSAGGGAVQIAASGTVTVTGTIRANGGNGATPSNCSDGGATGGGSGGAVLLQATTVTTTGATLQTNGGNGATGDSSGLRIGGPGAGGSGSTSSSNAGGNGGGGSSEGGGGGGGGYGRIRVN